MRTKLLNPASSLSQVRNRAKSIITVLVWTFLSLALGCVVNVLGAQVQTVTCMDPGGFGLVIDPLVPLSSLKNAVNPVLPKDPGSLRPTLAVELVDYIQNQTAAIRLGKALFWDVQASSDNKVACASCHFHAGADRRHRNQLHPGSNGSFDGGTPNLALAAENFPFTVPDPNTGTPVVDSDNTAGSQGVAKSDFNGIDMFGNESTVLVPDPVFQVGGVNVRQVTGINTPSAINAVFNHRNFFDGRAQAEFNGVNPFGGRDINARVWILGYTGKPVPTYISIRNASLASQAVGPVLNEVEMSARSRTFPDVGRKLLLAKPLGLQAVQATDSVLGPLADTVTGKGLTTSYGALIQQAFWPKWWNATENVTVNGNPYSMMEANFSLFWGLAIQVYEATLVSDDTPIDQYLSLVGTNRPPADDPRTAALDPVVARWNAEGVPITRENILNGLLLFERPFVNGGLECIVCHNGPEMTAASVANVTGMHAADADFVNAGINLRAERMFMQIPPLPAGTTSLTVDTSNYTVLANGTTPVRVAVYDSGFYDIGVRPYTENLGLGGMDPFGNPLSFVKLYQTLRNPSFINVPGEAPGCGGLIVTNDLGLPLLSGPLRKTEATATRAQFKVPSLRNVELTGPYNHNGGKATLMQAMEFYDGGGDFRANPDLSPAMIPLNVTPQILTNLVAFLVSLTDERVRFQRAPFDHPELVVPHGNNPDGSEITLTLPAVGAAGSDTPQPRFLDLNPFAP